MLRMRSNDTYHRFERQKKRREESLRVSICEWRMFWHSGLKLLGRCGVFPVFFLRGEQRLARGEDLWDRVAEVDFRVLRQRLIHRVLEVLRGELDFVRFGLLVVAVLVRVGQRTFLGHVHFSFDLSDALLAGLARDLLFVLNLGHLRELLGFDHRSTPVGLRLLLHDLLMSSGDHVSNELGQIVAMPTSASRLTAFSPAPSFRSCDEWLRESSAWSLGKGKILRGGIERCSYLESS